MINSRRRVTSKDHSLTSLFAGWSLSNSSERTRSRAATAFKNSQGLTSAVRITCRSISASVISDPVTMDASFLSSLSSILVFSPERATSASAAGRPIAFP